MKRRLIKRSKPPKVVTARRRRFNIRPNGLATCWDALGSLLHFPDLEPWDRPTKGDRCEYEDGTPANGEYMFPDESTMRVKDGTITKIRPPKKQLVQEAIASRKRERRVTMTLESLRLLERSKKHSKRT